MKWLLGFLFLTSIAGCTGKEGPMGPQGEQGLQGEQGEQGEQGSRGSRGSTANIDRLEAKVDSLESIITYALGGTPENEEPLTLGEETTFAFVPNKLAKDYTNFATDTKIYGELANTGDFDAVDVKIHFRFRSGAGVALLDESIFLGTIRSGNSETFSFDIDGSPNDYAKASYTITYSGGSEITGTISLERI